MDLVNEDLVDLVHDRVCFLRAKPFRKCGKSLHVTEEHRNLLTLTLDSIPLGQDFLSNAFGEVALNLCQFLI